MTTGLPEDGAAASEDDDARDPVEILVEDYFDRRRRGDPADPDEFARRVPGREQEFRRLLEALDVLESAATDATDARERIGRFRLLRLVGRGGMGSVYEAIDGELDRHVALKVLPGHATLDGREIARFRREAHAAARLTHPNIVPLFGVGEDGGVHWLAMQFVVGESLDHVLRTERDGATARTTTVDVARHGAAIADALAYAHSEGVLHRDVKPSNLLLDSSGTIWVTDFGLATSEGSATITRTGEAIGTPRYMAPEAFSGWADPRTDVWGVGATLYEMLAGRPAFDGTDRAQLLRQISEVEPAPLRGIDATIPRDLATIVTKCLQKEPAARYASARELADDLRRFLAGEAIRARPPSLAYRIGLVARRHPLATALLSIALAAGTVISVREAARARAAEHRSERRFEDVRKLAGTFLFEIHDAIRNLPGSTPARAIVVRRALEYLDKLSTEDADDPGLRREFAAAYMKVGDVQGNPYQPNLGDTVGARKSYQAAIDLMEHAVAARSATEEDRALLASALVVAAGIELVLGDAEKAAALATRGLELRKELAARDPSSQRRQELATAWQYLAYILGTTHRDAETFAALREQATILRELLAATPDDATLRRSWGQNVTLTAHALDRKQDDEAARNAYRDAIDVQRALLAADPGNTTLQRDLAWSLADFGNMLARMGEGPAALQTTREAHALQTALAQADPQSVDALTGLAMSHKNLGGVLIDLGRFDEALDPLTEAVSELERLVAADPSSVFLQGLLASAFTFAAIANAGVGDSASLESACDLFAKSLAIFERLADAGQLPQQLKATFASARTGLEKCEARLAK